MGDVRARVWARGLSDAGAVDLEGWGSKSTDFAVVTGKVERLGCAYAGEFLVSVSLRPAKERLGAAGRLEGRES